MQFAPRYRRTADGELVVLAPDAGWQPGDTIELALPGRERRTLTVRKVSRPFATGLGHAVYIRPLETANPDPPGTCDHCGAATSELTRTIDVNNVAGQVCQACNAVPYRMLAFA